MSHRCECSFRLLSRTLTALVTAGLLAGCTTGFVYNRLDRAAYWYLSRQVTLSDAQARILRTDLKQLLQWHRESELPRYAALLESLSRDALRPLGRERIEDTRIEVEGLWREIVRRAASSSAPWLAGLTDEQVEELLANLAQDDEELRSSCSRRRSAGRRPIAWASSRIVNVC